MLTAWARLRTPAGAGDRGPEAGGCARPGRTSIELRPQVREVRLWVDVRTSDALEQNARRIHPAVSIHILREPLAHRPELPACELLLDVAEIGACPIPDLHRDDVPELVRREVADQPDRPVHVLEDAVRIVRHVDAEVLLHSRIPRRRQIANGQRPGEQLQLELEAQDDVEPIRDLVRIAAERTGPDRIHRADERLLVDGAEPVCEERLQLWVEPAPEPDAAADEVLPRPTLRLVDRARRADAERRARERGVDRVVVDPVPELVHRREERRELALIRVRGQPDVPHTRLLRERVRRLVYPPLALVEPECSEHAMPRLLLRRDGERP